MTISPEPSPKDLFARAVDLPLDERAGFLDDSCKGNASLRERVESLLRAHESAGKFLGDPSLSDTDHTPSLSAPDEHAPGDEIGQYTITRKLGEGGFGTVYLAHQHEPVERTVAIKILKPGMDSRQIIARFEAERQTLARMDHPGIARIFDAGSTPQGRPFVVMEHVQGAPITTQCDERDLTIRQRLELFERVCRSVQHAHNKGIMHRDLKPPNVLVASIDDTLHPKIIDFGIAKAIEGRPEDHTLQTHAQQLLGTPAYMSPEQVSLDDNDIDTRTDVYSLGVLLFELLTGQTPFDQQTFRSAPLSKIQDVIQNQQPPRPSSVVGTGVDTQDRNEHAIRALRRQLAGELDWIVLRALEKDPARRYQTADALADDIERYLRDEPIEARPPSRIYHLSKLFSRHKMEFASAATIIVMLVLTVIFSVYYADRAKRAKEEAIAALERADAAQQEALLASEEAQRELEKFEAIAQFTKTMLQSVDPAISRGLDTQLLAAMLEDAAERLDRHASIQPDVEIDLRRTIAEVYRKMGQLDRAEQMFRVVLERAIDIYGERSDHAIAAGSDLGLVLLQESKFDDARPLLENAVEAAIETLGHDSLLTLAAQSNLAKLLADTGEMDRAIELHERVLERYIVLLGDEHEDTMDQRNSLAHTYSSPEDRPAAIELYKTVIAWQQINLGFDHPKTLMTKNNLADSYMDSGQWGLAETLLLDVIETKQRVLPPDHISLITSMNNLATLYNNTERYDDAEPIFLELLEMSERSLGPDNIRTLVLLNNLGSVYAKQERYDEAIPMVQTLLTRFTDVAGETHPNTVMVGGNLAALYLFDARYEDGISQIEATIALAQEVFGTDSSQHASYLKTKGELLLGMGRQQEAVALLQRVLEDYTRLYGPDDERTHKVRELIPAEKTDSPTT